MPHFVSADGVNLFYERKGNPNAPNKIVFVVGFGGTHLALEFQADYFSSLPNYQVASIDNRGVGLSDVPESSFTMEQMSGDVFALANHLNWDKFHLAGVSLGGMIAQHVALNHPENILSLTLLCTRLEGGLVKSFPTFWGTIGFLRTFLAKDQDSFLESVMNLQYPKSFLDSPLPEGGTNKDKILSMLRRRNEGLGETSPKAKRGKRGQMAVIRAHGLNTTEIEFLKKANFPKLAIVGDQDILMPPSHSYEMPSMIGAKLVVIKDAGHSIAQQCSDQVNNAIKDFIEDTLKNDIIIEDSNGEIITLSQKSTDPTPVDFVMTEKPVDYIEFQQVSEI